MLTFEGSIEVLIEKVKRPFISSFKNNFDSILKVNAHLIGLKIVRRFLVKTILGSLLFTF